MKKLAILLCLFASSVLAYEAVFFSFDVAASSTNTQTRTGVTGKVVKSIVYRAQTHAITNALSVYTTANTGATLGALRSIVAATNVTTAAVEGSPSVYLHSDSVTMRATNPETNGTVAITGVLILEHP